uniref:hypothetical protein n=1 Tax=Escherichia coli TaxID=562 RepID=UPI001F255442|nr:hypothetical protein [Escherichia coli]UGK56761.1 hypothetical protein [Escherichia coli]
MWKSTLREKNAQQVLKVSMQSNAPIPSDSVAYSAMIDALTGNLDAPLRSGNYVASVPGTDDRHCNDQPQINFSHLHATSLPASSVEIIESVQITDGQLIHFGHEEIFKLSFLNI